MAEHVQEDSTGSNVDARILFSFKTVNGKFVVEPSEFINALDEGKREQCHVLLNTYNDALAKVKEKGYDPEIIRMLIKSSSQLVLIHPNKTIEKLEESLAPLRYELGTLHFFLDNDVVSTDVQSTREALGNFRLSSVFIKIF